VFVDIAFTALPLLVGHQELVSWSLTSLFQHKYGYIRDDWASGRKSSL